MVMELELVQVSDLKMELATVLQLVLVQVPELVMELVPKVKGAEDNNGPSLLK